MIAELAARLAADADLRAAVAGAAGPEQAAAALVGAGFAVTAADVTLAADGALADADLDAVAGGGPYPDGPPATFAFVWGICVY